MVTIEFESFQNMKDTIASSESISAERFKPNKFHTISLKSGGTVKSALRITMILSAGRIVLLYDSPATELIDVSQDDWFKDSVEVENVGEQVT